MRHRRIISPSDATASLSSISFLIAVSSALSSPLVCESHTSSFCCETASLSSISFLIAVSSALSSSLDCLTVSSSARVDLNLSCTSLSLKHANNTQRSPQPLRIVGCCSNRNCLFQETRMRSSTKSRRPAIKIASFLLIGSPGRIASCQLENVRPKWVRLLTYGACCPTWSGAARWPMTRQAPQGRVGE